MEKWAEIEGTNGRYAVSTKGRVKSIGVDIVRENGRRYRTHDRYVGGFCKQGVVAWILYVSGERSLKCVHRLVADAFIPEIEGKDKVIHIDGDIYNNNVENLLRVDMFDVNRETKRIDKIISKKRNYRDFDSHYARRISTRGNFIKACYRAGKNFDDYREVYVCKDDRSIKKYIYVKKEI